MRSRYPLTDWVATFGLLVGWTAQAAGKTYHATVPLQTLTWDYRDGERVLASLILGIKMFAPQGVRVQLLNTDLEPPGGVARAEATQPPDPFEDVVYTLQFTIHIPATTPATDNLLLSVWAHQMATGAVEPPPAAWPGVATNASPITLRTVGGTAIAARWVEI